MLEIGKKLQDKKNALKKNKTDEPPSDDVLIEEALAASDITKQNKLAKKKRNKRLIISAGFLFFCYVVYMLFVPYKGTMRYGICKVFIELRVQYPQYLKFVSTYDFGTSQRIWYSITDAFGQQRMEPIQCYYKNDPQRGMILEKVTIRRKEVDADIVEKFNKTIPLLYAFPPDLTLPPGFPNKLQNLHYNYNPFIKPIL